MRFEVRYPSGPPHEVELSGTVAVLGRDPSCDLVLNDAKCSRRHAVLEAGPQGIAIRDAGSANGVFVNGKKIERANLVDGDVVRIGEVILKVLREEVAGTLVMGADEIEAQGGPGGGATDRTASVPPIDSPFSRGIPAAIAAPAAPAQALPRTSQPPPRAAPLPTTAPPPPPAAPPPPQRQAPAASPRPAPSSVPRASLPPRPAPVLGPGPRPLTITCLAVLWLLGVVLYPVGGILVAAAYGWSGGVAGLAAAIGFLGFFVSAAMAYGLWMRAAWARPLQIAMAGLGVFSCLFLPASAIILMYMLREETAAQFEGGRGAAEAENEPLYALGVVAASVIPYLLAALLGLVGAVAMPSFLGGGRPQAAGTVSFARLRAVAAAEQAFSSGTCGAFADLDGLLKPASVIPNYPPTGPAFLATEFAGSEAAGYRYRLRVEETVATSEGCPARSFKRFSYDAAPLGGRGRHYLIGSDGVIRVAEDRPATPSDPAAPE